MCLDHILKRSVVTRHWNKIKKAKKLKTKNYNKIIIGQIISKSRNKYSIF